MKFAVFVAACSASSVPLAAGAIGAQRTAAAAGIARQVGRGVRRSSCSGIASRSDDDVNGAIAAYKRAMELDPQAADIPARAGRRCTCGRTRCRKRWRAAEQALKIAPANREAHRVLGIIYAALSESGRATARGAARRRRRREPRQGDSASRSGARAADRRRPIRTCARRWRASTCGSGAYDKAIPLLYRSRRRRSPAGRTARRCWPRRTRAPAQTSDAIAWLEEHAADDPRLLPTLADFYERERRWKDAAAAYARALQRAPRNVELKVRYASALLNAGGRENLGEGARRAEAR